MALCIDKDIRGFFGPHNGAMLKQPRNIWIKVYPSMLSIRDTGRQRFMSLQLMVRAMPSEY